MMDLSQIQTEIAIYVIFWLIVIIKIITRYLNKKVENCGLTFIYIANFSLIHLIAASNYIFPSNWIGNETLMLAGFRESSYAFVFFGLGNVFLAPFFLRLFCAPKLNNNINMDEIKLKSRLPKFYLFLGIILYFVVTTKVRLPTINALILMGGQFVVVGICLLCWQAWCEKNMMKLRKWLIISLVFPLVTVVRDGFLGYGAGMTIIIYLFTFRFFRMKLKLIIISAFLVYLALSFYQVYMRDKASLRSLAWGGAPYSERIRALGDSISKPEWFNPMNIEHVERIEQRINQNILIGYAVEYLQLSGNSFAYGKTLWEAVLALIPRIFWKEKNVFAGSGSIVSEYTGLNFAESTSVGVGQVLEFYINFGRAGVIIGFLLLGIIVAIIDFKSGHYLTIGNLRKFSLWFLPGLSFCNIGGSWVEVTSSAGAGIVVVLLATKFYKN